MIFDGSKRISSSLNISYFCKFDMKSNLLTCCRIIQRVTSFRRDVREPANELSALPNIISDPEEKQVEIEWYAFR